MAYATSTRGPNASVATPTPTAARVDRITDSGDRVATFPTHVPTFKKAKARSDDHNIASVDEEEEAAALSPEVASKGPPPAKGCTEAKKAAV